MNIDMLCIDMLRVNAATYGQRTALSIGRVHDLVEEVDIPAILQSGSSRVSIHMNFDQTFHLCIRNII